MGIIAWIIFGALAGWIASIITGRNSQMGCLTNIVVGLVGAFIGGFVMDQIGGGGVGGFNLYSLIVAVLGAVILLVVLGFIQGRR
jgi:uncharacterized membrane protein YeaQ/YmgE (transglycosylase-associated protein family)